MVRLPMEDDDRGVPKDLAAELTDVPDSNALFDVLWAALIELLGSAATATVIRRSVKHAAVKRPALAQLTVTRGAFEHSYALPQAWSTHADDAFDDLCALLNTLQGVLTQLTGKVAMRRLRAIPELQRCRSAFEEDEG